jgi:hypothetical protein
MGIRLWCGIIVLKHLQRKKEITHMTGSNLGRHAYSFKDSGYTLIFPNDDEKAVLGVGYYLYMDGQIAWVKVI